MSKAFASTAVVDTVSVDAASADTAFESASAALRMAGAALDYLHAYAVADLDGATCGDVLVGLGEVQAKLAAAHAAVLRRFDAVGAHDADGYGSSSAWLSAKAGMSKGAARASVRRMRQLGERPLLGEALADGGITDSLAFTIADWTRKLPADMRTETDRILLDAAAAGASLDDLATIAAAAIEQWRQQQPDPDDADDTFEDRYVKVGTTFGGAGVIRGDLTPECAAAVRAVLEALGKKSGPEDDRTEDKRFHDALQLACELLLRARLVPDRAGADTQVLAVIPLSQLRQLPGAQELEDAWLRARLGEDGYLTGKDAQAAACDAQTVPVVTGTMDHSVIDQMINLARTAAEAAAPVSAEPPPRVDQPQEDPERRVAPPLPPPPPHSGGEAAKTSQTTSPPNPATNARTAEARTAKARATGARTVEGGVAEARAAEVRAAEARTAEDSATEARAAEARAAEGGAAEARTAEVRAAEAGTAEGGATEARAVEGGAAEARSAGARAAEGQAEAVRVRSASLSPEAWRTLRHEIARLAIDLVSGPTGVASALRRGLLDKPYNTPSLPLDVGYKDSIPGHIRRAVLLRDRGCAWPSCGRPAAHCDVHHLRHKADGGETSVTSCLALCQFHHDICVHRKGWQLSLHPDGTTEATSPDGTRVLTARTPPTSRP